MKTLKIFFLAIVLLLFAGNISSQNVIIITLNVNTGEVTNSNTDSSCNFGQPSDLSNRDFTTEAHAGDIIIWKGVSSNDPVNDVVQIKAINYEGGVNVFNRNTLRPKSNTSPNVVTATIRQDVVAGNEEKYRVDFKVLNNGTKRNGTFHIDPKIQIH